jgi:flagellin-like protein
MKLRRGISPFIATVILVAITLAIGGVLYTQFSNIVTAEVRNPSISVVDSNVAADRQTITLIVKNDGNVQYTLSKVLFSYQKTNEQFDFGSNATVISGAANMAPGDLTTLQFKVSGVSLSQFDSYTLTVVSNQLARAFTLQA